MIFSNCGSLYMVHYVCNDTLVTHDLVFATSYIFDC